MAKPTKQIIYYADLLEKVQSLLVCYPECRNIHVDGIEVYNERVDGANWRIATYSRSGDDNDLTACREKIVAEIRLLRASYDVAHLPPKVPRRERPSGRDE